MPAGFNHEQDVFGLGQVLQLDNGNRRVACLIPLLDVFAVEFLQYVMIIERLLVRFPASSSILHLYVFVV